MISQKLFNLFSSFGFDDKGLDQLWRKILASRDPFVGGRLEEFTNKSSYFAADEQRILAPFHGSPSSALPGDYVPIQAFRWLKSKFDSDPKARRFLSSGTTSTSRSQSYFSEEGLKFYRLTSCLHFFATLEAASGCDFDDYHGLCLVPSPKTAPHSSLATMLGWIAEFVSVDFISTSELTQAVDRKSPLFWIFGTSLQLFELCESKPSLTLPAQSFVFDTGGNKGRRVSLSEEEKLEKFSKFFGIQPQQLIREYGMCELASQAYAFWPCHARPKSQDPGSQWPAYRFPWWAPVAVSQGLHSNTSEGRGALIVSDRARIDLGVPIRTQDDVSLSADGSFRIFGRLSGAVLKGCSIEFEAKAPVSVNSGSAPVSSTQLDHNPRPFESLTKNFWQILSSQEFRQRLAIELGSEKIALSAIRDLLADWPQIPSQWPKVLESCRPHADGRPLPTGSKILIVLPGNHSIAGIYPVVLGLLHGMRLSVRLPAHLGSENSAIRYFLAEAQRLCGDLLHILEPEFEIHTPESVESFDAIFAVGSTQTMGQLREMIGPRPFQAMGSVHTILLADYESVLKSLDLIVKDFLSLRQLGCLSARLLLISGYGGGFDELERLLDQKVLEFAGPASSPEVVSALTEARIEFLLKGADSRVLKNSNNLLNVLDKSYLNSIPELCQSISENLAPVSFCFCVMRVGAIKPKELVEGLSRLADQFRVGLDAQSVSDNIGSFVIGQANRQKWDGNFGRWRLFDFMTHAKPTGLG